MGYYLRLTMLLAVVLTTAACDQGPKRAEASEMRTGEAGLAIIREYEDLRLDAYTGASGKLLIGYGHAGGVTPDMTITEKQAADFLKEDVREVEATIKRIVEVPLSQNEFDALASLGYNIGIGNLSKSSIIDQLNAGNRQEAADIFLTLNKYSSGGTLVSSDHLTARRKAERDLFLKP